MPSAPGGLTPRSAGGAANTAKEPSQSAAIDRHGEGEACGRRALLPGLKWGARKVMNALVCGAPSASPAGGASRVSDPMAARHAAALLAREAAGPDHTLFLDLSAAMCWDAVKLCAVTAGLLKPQADAQHHLISDSDPRVAGAEALSAVPEGHALGFFDGARLVHLMMSTGAGHAAGNKNDCIGLGHPAGWEVLDLNRLRWDGDGNVTAPGLLQPERTLVLRSRPLGE